MVNYFICFFIFAVELKKLTIFIRKYTLERQKLLSAGGKAIPPIKIALSLVIIVVIIIFGLTKLQKYIKKYHAFQYILKESAPTKPNPITTILYAILCL